MSTPVYKSKHGECIVCIDKKKLCCATRHCKHDPSMCYGCIQDYIQNAVLDGGSGIAQWDNPVVMCPDGCGSTMDPADVRHYATARAQTAYDKCLLMTCLRQDDQFVWCLAANCGSGQFHDGDEDTPIVQCSACGESGCFVCGVPFHTGTTCAQFQRNVERDGTQTNLYLNRNTKKCPNSDCNVHIEKKSGCDHMTCAKCAYQFCWRCSADYQQILEHGNHYHNPACAYYCSITE